MTPEQSLELLANACTGYLLARDQLKFAPDGSDDERCALMNAVSALNVVRERTDLAIQVLSGKGAA